MIIKHITWSYIHIYPKNNYIEAYAIILKRKAC